MEAKSMLVLPKLMISKLFCHFFGTITSVSTPENLIALTFDDGPHPATTPYLLDILKKHDAKTTFFILGASARRYPLIVKKIEQFGHAICNHSWDHPSFAYISAQERRSQLRDCHNAIAPYGQKLFRPPYGDQTYASFMDALLAGYRVVAWNVSVDDWITNEPHWYVDRLKVNLTPGSIVLLHDVLYQRAGGYDDNNRKNVFHGLDILLDQVGAQYRFVTVPELLKHGRPQKKLWFRKSDIDWLNSLIRKSGPVRAYSRVTRR
jgi:peptidoglycan-N-acetylglucosamine deacetylase